MGSTRVPAELLLAHARATGDLGCLRALIQLIASARASPAFPREPPTSGATPPPIGPIGGQMSDSGASSQAAKEAQQRSFALARVARNAFA